MHVSVCVCVCVCLVCVCVWGGGCWHQRESGIWFTVWLQLRTYTNTHKQTHERVAVFSPLKHLYELTY